MTAPDKVRILVAEDSPTARQLLVEILRADPALEVVGEARDGLEAVELTHRLRPSLVTMDIHMPRMDGLEATERIMHEVPTPVVVVSTLVERDIQMSMRALRVGALAVLQKLVGPTSPSFESDSRRLRETVKAMAQVKVVRHWPASRLAAPTPLRPVPTRQAPQVVALAASTGGPAALHRILSALPPTFPLPLLVVQHIALGFAAGFASWLSSASRLPVAVAREGEPLVGGRVYIAPDDQHLGVGPTPRGPGVRLSGAAPVGGFRPSGTFLFRSVAEQFGASALAVVLTGMGEDGVEGLRAIRQAGGRVLAQDEASSVVYGMPGAAVAAGLVDRVLPLEDVALHLASLAAPPPAT